MDRIESWRPVPGWVGWYDASDLGRVRSLDRWVTYRNGRRHFHRGQVLVGRVQVRPHGSYRVVQLSRPGTVLTVMVSVLVLTAFAGPPKPGEIACHGRGGSLDNRWPENLYWGTWVRNAADRERDGNTRRGEGHPNARLTEAGVIEARQLRAAGYSFAALAARYGVSVSVMFDAVTGRSWRHLPQVPA